MEGMETLLSRDPRGPVAKCPGALAYRGRCGVTIPANRTYCRFYTRTIESSRRA